MKFYNWLNESKSIDINFIKENIKKAIEEDPKRLGHGDTGKTGFWILPNGRILPHSKGYREAYKSGNVINVHSHSSADIYKKDKDEILKEPFNTFSGGDIKVLDHMIKNNYGDIIVVISASGYMDILKGGKWKKEDYRFDDIPKEKREDLYEKHGDKYKEILLSELAKKRGAEYITNIKWK